MEIKLWSNYRAMVNTSGKPLKQGLIDRTAPTFCRTLSSLFYMRLLCDILVEPKG